MKPIKIGDRLIGNDEPNLIVAEIGINHNGSLDIALKMLEEAAKSGVDAVKVQIITAAKSYAKTNPSCLFCLT